MTLRRRVFFLLVVTLVLIASFEYFFNIFLSNKNFRVYETRQVQRSIDRAQNALNQELEHLQIFATDWSSWDETYKFAQSRDKKFVEQELITQFYITSRINYCAIIDNNNEFAYARGYDFLNSTDQEFPELTAEFFRNSGLVFPISDKLLCNKGILRLSNSDMLVAALPILTSENNGPSTGTLIMGRLLDKTMNDRLAKNIELQFSLALQSSTNDSILQHLRTEKKWIDDSHTNSLYKSGSIGYSLVNDIRGKPEYVIIVVVPNELKPLLDAQNFGSFASILVLLSLYGALWLLLSQTVLKRVESLTNQVSRIGEQAESSLRTSITGNDELSILSGRINSMLENLYRAGETLNEANRRFRDILSNVRLLGFILNAEGKVEFVNKCVQEITGWSEAELIGQSWFEKTVPEKYRDKRYRDFIESIASSRFDLQPLSEIETRSGERRTILFNQIPLHDQTGQIVGVAVIGEDITDRILAEAEIRRLATLVEASTEAIIITDLETNLIYINPAFTRTFGYSAQEVLGRPFALLQSDRHGGEFYHEIWQTVSRGIVWNGELFGNRRGGGSIELAIAFLPLRDPSGELTHYGIFARDVTQQNEMQTQLNRAQRFVAIGELTGGIAHNFNNVLTVIMGNIGLAKFAERDQAKTCLSEAENACFRASDLIKQLMVFSRRTQIERLPVSVNELIREVTTLVRSTFDRRFEIVQESPKPLRKVDGDASQLHQVLLNMCFNAKDALYAVATDSNRQLRITLSAREEEIENKIVDAEERSGKFVCITVSDTGCGMTSEVLKHIFEPFYTTKEVGQGTGLGLSTAFGIVKQHNGWISASSTINVGTTFQIYLPTMEGDTAIEDEDKPPSASLRGTESILLIEDEEMVRKYALLLLQGLGYRITIAQNGLEGLKIIEQRKGEFSLIILDISMPVMTGIEFLTRAATVDPTIRVILASGLPKIELAPELEQMVIGSVPKPYRPDELVRAIRKALETKSET